MRKTLSGLAAITAVVASAACSGGGGGVPPLSLKSGTYLVSNMIASPNECDAPLGFGDGDSIDVFVSGNMVNIGGVDFTRSGDALDSSSLAAVYDFTTTAAQIAQGIDPPLSRGYDCIERDVYHDTAQITVADAFAYTADVMWLVSSGTAAECSAAESSAYLVAITVPCHTQTLFDAVKQ